MIDRQEILEFAGEVGLDPNVVEKDYVLGWMLAGIAQHPQTRDTWVCKGGTCLKKCYFETYRFSEDLDFTLLDGSHVDETVLRGLFVEITEWIYDQSGIEFPEEARLFEVYRNPRGKKSGHSRIGYRGPMGRPGDPPRGRIGKTSRRYGSDCGERARPGARAKQEPAAARTGCDCSVQPAPPRRQAARQGSAGIAGSDRR